MSILKKKVDTKNEVKTKKVNNKDKKVVTSEKKRVDWKKIFTKVNITYAILLLLDIVLVIYLARKNIVNYVEVLGVEVFASKTRYLLWGRNYVNLVVIVFFYIYTCLINKFFLKRKNTKKFLILLLAILVILNVFLFVLFTKKIY